MNKKISARPVELYDGSTEHGHLKPSSWKNTALLLQIAVSNLGQQDSQENQAGLDIHAS
jgi:hypothetical protein